MICRLILLLLCLHLATRAEVPKGECNCSIFEVNGTEPLAEQVLPFEVSCDDDGSEKCMQLCHAIGQTAKDKAPSLICEKLNRHVENLQVEVHSRACGAGAWKFTGLQTTDPICCHEGKDTKCNLA